MLLETASKMYSTKIDNIIRKNGETHHHNGNFYHLSQELKIKQEKS